MDDDKRNERPEWMTRMDQLFSELTDEQAETIDRAEGKYDDILSGKRPEGMTKAEFLSAMQRTKAQWS